MVRRSLALAALLFGIFAASSAQAGFKQFAWVTTPATLPASPNPETIACGDCKSSDSLTVTWQTYLLSGMYIVTLKGLAPAAGDKWEVQAAPVGTNSASCAVTSAATSGTDFKVIVSCTDSTNHTVPTRFTLFFLSEATGPATDYGAYAFTKVVASPSAAIDFTSTWTSSASSVSVSNPVTGDYRVVFSGMAGALAGKPVFVTPALTGVRCEPLAVATVNIFDASIFVACWHSSTATLIAAPFYLQVGGPTQGTAPSHGILFSYTTAPALNTFTSIPAANGGDGSLTGVWHVGTGSYIVEMPSVWFNGSPRPSRAALVKPHGGAALTACHLSEWQGPLNDSYGMLTVNCTNGPTAQPVDTQFSVLTLAGGTSSADWYNDKNWQSDTVDVGYGILCARDAFEDGTKVGCGLGLDSPALFVAPTNPSVGSQVLSVAIDNVSPRTTRVLALAGNGLTIYASSGDTSKTWGSPGNFDAWTVFAQPSNVRLKKIVAMRFDNSTSTRILGLGTDGKVYTPVADSTVWFAVSSTTMKDISHGIINGYFLGTDGRAYRYDGSTLTALPGLPSGYRILALAGRYAVSDAGAPAGGGNIICSSPAFTGGGTIPPVTCPGEANRFYQLVGDSTPGPFWTVFHDNNGLQFNDVYDDFSNFQCPANYPACFDTDSSGRITYHMADPWTGYVDLPRGFNTLPSITDARMFLGESATFFVIDRNANRLYLHRQ